MIFYFSFDANLNNKIEKINHLMDISFIMNFNDFNMNIDNFTKEEKVETVNFRTFENIEDLKNNFNLTDFDNVLNQLGN